MTTILDENRIPSIIGVSENDGSTLISIKADATSHSMMVVSGLGGADHGGNPDPRDENRKVAFFATSAVDGVTPVAVYADATTGGLLIRTS